MEFYNLTLKSITASISYKKQVYGASGNHLCCLRSRQYTTKRWHGVTCLQPDSDWYYLYIGSDFILMNNTTGERLYKIDYPVPIVHHERKYSNSLNFEHCQKGALLSVKRFHSHLEKGTAAENANR